MVIDDSDPVEERLTAHFSGRAGVEKKKAFGHDALTINGKVFTIFRLGTFVLKLPREVGVPLVDSDAAEQFEPGPGRFMKEWFVFGPETDEDQLTDLAEQAHDFVRSLQD